MLDVDPEELVGAAAELADMVRVTSAAVPAEWVVPAGSDPISAAMVPRLNHEAAQLFNGMRGLLSAMQRSAHEVGAAAVDYVAADSANAGLIDGSSGTGISNPAGLPGEIPVLVPPVVTFPDPGAAADPLVFAQQLHGGPGPAAPARFAEAVRAFTTGASADAGRRVGSAATVLRNWRPVGTQASAELTRYHDWLDRTRGQLDRLATRVDAYSSAFRIARDKHPTPAEILTARKQLLAAMRSRNEVATQAALAKHEELNLRSVEAIGGYEGSMAADAAADAGSEGDDSSMLQALLPALMSALSQGGMLAGQTLTDGYYDDDYYDDYYDDYPNSGMPSMRDIGSPGSPSSNGPGVNPVYALGPMPMSAAPGTAPGGTAGSPRAPGFEPIRPTTPTSGMPMGRGTGMMPMMPMMPGAAGAGAGGGGDRGRVVAWHPDRLMYVDDTPHTEAVIGERPVIAPTVTPATPAPTTQTQNHAGGSA